MKTSVSVPGKIMLAGEYAVLKGEPALACTISDRLTATIEPSDNTLLHSNLWKRDVNLATASEQEEMKPLAHCVTECIGDDKVDPFRLSIDSDLEVSYGVGSSSAFRLATAAAITAFRNRTRTFEELKWTPVKLSHRIQREFQSKASGYDIATQFRGGIIEFRNKPDQDLEENSLEKIGVDAGKLNEFIHPVVGTKGAPTKNLLGKTLSWIDAQGLWSEIIDENKQLIESFKNHFASGSVQSLANLIFHIKMHRRIFEKSPYFPDWLRELNSLKNVDKTWSYKLTGAGGEDAILLFGKRDDIKPALQFFYSKGWDEPRFIFAEEGMIVDHQESGNHSF